MPGAAAAFALAYELSKDHRILYNLAQVQEDLRDNAQALRSLELYLARGGAQIGAERREEVVRTQAELERRSASVRVTTNVAGASLWIDGVPAGALPSDRTWLNPGVHQLIVAAQGRPPSAQALVLLPGERRLLEVPLHMAEPAPAAHAGGATSAPLAERAWLWIGIGGAGASAALAAAFALLTRDAEARLDRELARYPADAEALDAARSRVTTLAAATDVCIGASVVSAGISLYFALRSPGRDDTTLGALRDIRLELAPSASGVVFTRAF